ncbi:hypothetical protein C2845_PM08G04470 [Panicum miliaceum]|uniref:KIB1-4 beta-propeller domain-containing protein n=1 Tax=Panicum miliaceum TaxID=4540 RepID=A0A3L6R3A7_PANMI|nr:hypothetical protein C2845_PM08G04470 [Panicum miliaceum]
MVAVQGKFYYFMGTLDEVGVLSFARDPEPRMEMSSFGATTPRFDRYAATLGATMSYLLESPQELFLVCLFFLGCHFERVEEVAAYKMDFSKKEWCKVIDIGDRAFLLGPHSFAASCSAGEHGLKRGCVYFAFDFFGITNNFHIFDLREGTRELTGTDLDVPLPVGQMFLDGSHVP